MAIKRRVNDASPLEDREHGANQSLFIYWDITERPLKNDRKKKLGRFAMAMAAAVDEVKKGTLSDPLADGYQPGGGASSLVFVEPDSWVPRFHEKDAQGNDVVLAPRLIADHSNKTDKRKHRSTMVIDECDSQRWGWLQSLFWVVDLGAIVADRELEFNGAGFLHMLYPDSENESWPAEGAVANNVAKNAGFVTDGDIVAQFWHFFTMGFPSAPGQTVAGPGQTTTGAASCAPKAKGNLMMRGDGLIDFGQDVGQLEPPLQTPADAQEGDDDDEARVVHLAYVGPGSVNPQLDLKADASSNQPAIARVAGQLIGGLVRVKKTPPDPG